jgi:hypothetical protein
MEFEKIIQECDNSPIGAVIKNKQFINYLTKSINFIYGVKGTELTFPGPQPVSIERKDFTKLQQYKYYVSLKLDGVRFLMYFIKDKNERSQCIIVNRALNFFNINIKCEENIYNGTLFDGEVIFNKTDNKWYFYIHDALVLCGNKINKLTHSVRLNDTKCCIQTYIDNGNAGNNDNAKNNDNGTDIKNTLIISVKEFYEFSNFNNFVEKVYSSSNNVYNDGLIFMPENLPVISGTQYSMLKWKPEDKHTFDFLIKEVEIGLEVYVYHMGNIKQFANIHNKTDEGKTFIDMVKSMDKYKNECIVECSFNKEINNFTPLLIRTDKTHPNSLRTIERTLFNINENIKIEDFAKLLEE